LYLAANQSYSFGLTKKTVIANSYGSLKLQISSKLNWLKKKNAFENKVYMINFIGWTWSSLLK
jgi:hypothetical protein